MRYMGRRFYLDENRRFFRTIAKLLYISWYMCLLYSDSKVGLFLKWDRKRVWGFRFLDKGEAGFFTDSFLSLRQQKKSVVHEARQTFISCGKDDRDYFTQAESHFTESHATAAHFTESQAA